MLNDDSIKHFRLNRNRDKPAVLFELKQPGTTDYRNGRLHGVVIEWEMTEKNLVDRETRLKQAGENTSTTSAALALLRSSFPKAG
jgi:hypothetical protein